MLGCFPMPVAQSQMSFLGQRAIPYNGRLLDNIVLGIGISGSGVAADGEGVEDFIRFAMGILNIKVLSGVATISKPVTVPFLRELSSNFGDIPILCYTAEQLEQETMRLARPSRMVYHLIGCHGVAEAAALRATGSQGHLILKKTVCNRVTFALAGRGSA